MNRNWTGLQTLSSGVRFAITFAAALLVQNVSAQAVYKCKGDDGVVSYQQAPCAGPQTALPPPRIDPPPNVATGNIGPIRRDNNPPGEPPHGGGSGVSEIPGLKTGVVSSGGPYCTDGKRMWASYLPCAPGQSLTKQMRDQASRPLPMDDEPILRERAELCGKLDPRERAARNECTTWKDR